MSEAAHGSVSRATVGSDSVAAFAGVPLGMAALKLLIHLPVLHRFGWHHDELYFVACGRHLAFGYVDHAPLVSWIARVATTLFGESVYGLRLFAALAGCLTILLVGLLTRRLGGGPFAQLMACGAWLVAPVALRTGNMLAIPSFEPLFWVGGAYILACILDGGSSRLWLALGLVAGVGLMNKHSMLFFGFGLAVAVLATPLRRSLRTPWPYLGAVVALAIFLPNVIWQIQNGWPTAGFLRNLNENVMAGISKLQFILGQFLYLNPFSSFVWVCGLVFLFSKAGKPYRLFAWMWLAIFGLLLATDSKIYYLSPAYPMLIAAGGVAVERFAARCMRDGKRRWLRPALLVPVAIGGLLFGPSSVPYLSIGNIDRFMTTMTFGAMENVYELTGDLHGMFGWPERVDAVDRAWNALLPEERRRTVLFADGYGVAGAVEFLGRERGLPPAISFSQTNWMWSDDPETSLDQVLALGFSREFLEQIWGEIEVVESIELPNANPWDSPFEIMLCREPKMTMERLWPQVRPW